MAERVLSREEILTLLAQGPQRIATATAGASLAQLHTAAPGEWSANDVLAHLRACADVWGDAMRLIVHEDEPTFRAVNPRTWIEKTDYPNLEFPISLAAFTDQRAKLLAFLESLPTEAWPRSATVKGAGRTLTRTVHFYAQWLATHERPHLKQIENIVVALRR